MSGRPTLYTAEIADRILDELSGGRTLRDVSRDDGMPPHNTVRGWVIDDREGFAARYKRAREIGYDSMADEILEIADDGRNDWIVRRKDGGSTELTVDHEHINRSRLRVDARRWLLSKALPKTYGDRLDLNARHEAGNDLKELMRAIDGRTRGLPNIKLLPPENEAE